MSAVTQLIQAGDIAGLLRLTEAEELKPNHDPVSYSIQLASYLLMDRLTDAKYLWKRIPNGLKEAHPELSIIWNLGACLYRRDYAAFNAAASASKLSDDINQLIVMLVEHVRQQNFELISKAYTKILVTEAALLLGYSTDEALSRLTQAGWQHDGDVLIPAPIITPAVKPCGVTGMDRLTNYIIHLEKV